MQGPFGWTYKLTPLVVVSTFPPTGRQWHPTTVADFATVDAEAAWVPGSPDVSVARLATAAAAMQTCVAEPNLFFIISTSLLWTGKNDGRVGGPNCIRRWIGRPGAGQRVTQ